MPIRRRPRKTTGIRSFDSFLDTSKRQVQRRLGSEPRPRASIVISTCSGSEALSTELGRHVCVVRVARHADRLMTELGRRKHGAYIVDATRTDGMRETEGWSDWRTVPLSYDMTWGEALIEGVTLVAGRLEVALSPGSPISVFARQLALLLNPRRHHDALMVGPALQRRADRGLPLEVVPRYAMPTGGSGLERVEDLYVLDPWTDLPVLATTASAAAMASDPGAENGMSIVSRKRG